MSEQGFNEATVSAAIAGDRDAAALLWEQSRRWAAAVLLAHKPRDADLDDLLQAVAMRVCTRITTLTEPRAFKGWLRTVAINTAREEGRRTSRRRNSMLRLVGIERARENAVVPGDEALARDEESRRVYEAARSLPPGYREPVLLRCLRSMSYEQIGEVMGLPVTTIETRIARGRRMLREILESQQQETEEPTRGPAQEATPAIGGAR
ncbi:MAG: sigma-70 family RNA polymerase sigma factor [Phycisphaerales bacterium]